jgi:hypothetical protein
MITVEKLLGELPPYQDQWVVIHPNQTVKDIIAEVLAAHREFAGYYDAIALYFDGKTVEDICNNLYDFLKENIHYCEEKEEAQTTALPTGILTRRQGDCKHYAEFSAGVLNALNRLTDAGINWCYRFASYTSCKTPGHVFVVVKGSDGSEIWIDPTPGADRVSPVWYIDKKINVSEMALLRNVSGVGLLPDQEIQIEVGLPTTENQVLSDARIQALQDEEADQEITPELEAAIRVLIQFNVMNDKGEVNDYLLQSLAGTIDFDQFEELAHARNILQEYITRQALGNIFSTIWRGVKKVTMAVPRNAYLSLVALNVFGLGTKLYHAIFNADGSYFQPNQDNLYNKWHSFGGDWHSLLIAIKSGFKKHAILGSVDCMECVETIGVAPAIPVWVAAATAIIAALTPLIKDMINKKAAAGQLDPGINPATGLPYGVDPNGGGGGGGGIMAWIQANPIPVALAAAGGVYYFTQPKNKR